ncbi:hypothetical protein RB601_002240 [Gaeumannomyces tritici]
MAPKPKTRLAILIATLALPRDVFSIQVTPNSPCASSCMDSPSLDRSDPKSSNTRPSDMTCADADYNQSPGGRKWKSCITCLEKSGYSQGSESDQGWYLYNIRYNFNYCIFGFPNNTAIGSNPCQTSRACGALANALQHDSSGPDPKGDYTYCNADGGSMTGEFYDKCLTCIGGFKEQGYVRNGLVALEAGCQQRPAPGKTVGISGSIFSSDRITILNARAGDKDGEGSGAPTTTIVIAVISGVIGLAAVAAVVYMCVRKRRNRRDRAGLRRSGGGDHRRQSSLSFWCPTPRNPNPLQMFAGPGGDGYDDLAAAQVQHQQQDHQHQQQQQQKPQHIVSVRDSVTPTPPANLWRTSHAVAATASLSPVDEDKKSHQAGWSPSSPRRQDWSFTPGHNDDDKKELTALGLDATGGDNGGLYQLKTSLPTPPRNAHASPMTASSAATPTSATQLLSYAHAPYVPADHPPVAAGGSPMSARFPRGGGGGGRQSPAASPQQQWGWPAPAAAPPARSATASPPPPSSRSPRVGPPPAGRRGGRNTASPVESNAIQTSFSGPPRR